MAYSAKSEAASQRPRVFDETEYAETWTTFHVTQTADDADRPQQGDHLDNTTADLITTFTCARVAMRPQTGKGTLWIATWTRPKMGA